jgi:formylmethanofuran dehydrogenase subunit E
LIDEEIGEETFRMSDLMKTDMTFDLSDSKNGIEVAVEEDHLYSSQEESKDSFEDQPNSLEVS